MFYKLPPQLQSEISELGKKIEDANSGILKTAELKAYRVPFGVYEQRKSNTYMMRVRCPGGAVTPDQLRTIAQLAQLYGASILHVTTRQELQLHDIRLQDIIPIMRRLKDAGLSTRGGGGNTVRNIVASPSSGVDPQEPFDVSPYVFALTSRFLSEADSWLLPRKFKIAFSNTEADTVQAAFHDVGFVATQREGRPGFVVYLAGGLGAKPAAGRRVHEFLPAEEAYITAEAVKRLYGRHGNRRNKHRNRLRFLWEEMGEQAFLDRYRFFEEEVRATKPEPLIWEAETSRVSFPLPAPMRVDGNAFEQWKRRYVFPDKRPRMYQVLFPVPHGNVPANQALHLADFLQAFGPDSLRGTREQNFLLRHIPESHLGNVYELLKGWNVLVESAPFLARTIVCTGSATCKLGICSPRPAVDAIIEQLIRADLPLDELGNFRMNISGCPNSCGNHWIADLGFFGRAAHKGGRVYPAYSVVAGGRVGGSEIALAKRVAEVAARHLPAFVHEFIGSYLAEKSLFASFQEYLENDGIENLQSLCRKYAEPPEFDTNPDFYTDWGGTKPFSLSDRGQGECSAGLFDLIEFDLKKAREIATALESERLIENRDELLHQAILYSARALLVTRGTEPHGEPHMFDLFLKHFVDTGLVEERFRPLLESSVSKDSAAAKIHLGDVRDLLSAVEALYRRMDDSFHFNPEKDASVAIKETRADGPKVLFKDLRGVACPMNFVRAKIALDTMKAGQRLAVLLDDGSPIESLPRSIQGEGHKILEQITKGDHWYVLIEKR